MKILRRRKELREFLQSLQKRASGTQSTIAEKVGTILRDVRQRGDEAVFHYTALFDSLSLKKLRIHKNEMIQHAKKSDPKVFRALKKSATRIRTFHSRQKERSWSYTEGKTVIGQILQPLERVGIYVPGGKASYPSSVLMNVIPAQVAGVKEIAVCVPTPRGEVNPHVMAALTLLGITEAYRIGGAQAIGALAYGTKSIGKVDKIVGPGNIYVATAKKLVFGTVDIDMIAGPSEILVIADDSANPAFIAADLLSQAEHDELASSILITDSPALALAVRHELAEQLGTLMRREIAQKSIDAFGALIVVKDITAAADLANTIAPEHLEIMTRKPQHLLSIIRNAGAIFLGEWTPEAIGDYAAGPNHTLPTGGTARFSSPLGVYDFMKRTSLMRFSRDGFMKIAETVKTIAGAEGLEAHGNAIERETETAEVTLAMTSV